MTYIWIVKLTLKLIKVHNLTYCLELDIAQYIVKSSISLFLDQVHIPLELLIVAHFLGGSKTSLGKGTRTPLWTLPTLHSSGTGALTLPTWLRWWKWIRKAHSPSITITSIFSWKTRDCSNPTLHSQQIETQLRWCSSFGCRPHFSLSLASRWWRWGPVTVSCTNVLSLAARDAVSFTVG